MSKDHIDRGGPVVTREERAREALAAAFDAENLKRSAEAMRSGTALHNNLWAQSSIAAMLAFADAEAAAMRERAAGVADDFHSHMAEILEVSESSPEVMVNITTSMQAASHIATAIRDLPATGEVKR